jgi:hypothetical protein
VHLEQLKGLLDEITQVEAFSLAVIDLVTDVGVLGLEQVHDWKNLSVVWYECLTNGIRACNQCLQNLQANGDVFWVSCVQAGLDWNNQLWNNWKYLGTTLFEHVKYTLDSEEPVWVHFLSDTLEEDWQVVMVIELLDVNFPINFVLWGLMLNSHWQVSSVIK